VTPLPRPGFCYTSGHWTGTSMEVTSGNGTRMVQFGVFEVDLRAGELRRNGSRVRLQEQPFQILALLLERPGEVVTRDQLRTRLWPADTFVDFDHSLNAAVRRLRDALGDSAENPRFVETVARRGYRFLAPVDGATPAVASSAPVTPKPAHDWRLAAAAGILLLAGIGVGLFVGRRAPPSLSPPTPIVERRLTANPDDDPVSSAAISADGKNLALSDGTGFYLRQIDSGETHPLPLPEGFKAQPVAWFPDGDHILATSVAGPTQLPGLWQLSTIGGSPRKLSDQGREAAVSPDGSQIVFLKGAAKSQQVWLMRADGQQPRQIAGELGDLFRSPVWSADGKRVAFLRAAYRGADPQIEILDLANNQHTVVLTNTRLGPALAWLNDRIFYALREAPPSQTETNVWSLTVDSRTGKPLGAPTRITSSVGGVQSLSLSSDGKRLAYVKEGWQPDVYVARVEANGYRLSTPRRLTLDDRQDFPWAWTRDSKQVLFGSDRDGAFHIFRQSPEQTTPELLVGGSEQSMLPRLTPDGTQIVYLQFRQAFDSSGPIRMMRIPASGGPPQLVLESPGITNQQCARLPSTLCLYSEVEGKRLIWFRFDPLRGKGEEVAHIDDDLPYFYNWTLSPDGSVLAMAKKMDISVQPEIRLLALKERKDKERIVKLQGWSAITALDWAGDGKTLWVSASTTTGTNALLNVDLQGRARPVLQQTKMFVGWGIPSPDGRSLALWQASGRSNVWMVENF
jgi:Tol biopolymer transport system component/DNA-binding winged helix-turn-helix (wHTH) protein